MCFQMEKEQTRLDVNEMSLSENDSTNEDMEQSYKEIDNEWYTFVRNERNSDPERETQRLRAKENDERPAIEKSFRCKFCQKCFHNSSGLKIHERIHTGEVPFECKTCKKRFSQSNALKTHERIHTREVPYECKTCKKRFNQKAN